MKPKEIKTILSEIGARSNKSLGQHFLIDEKVLSDIVGAAAIASGESVLEIGPGLGVLTNALLSAGADVTAIERDRKFAERLDAQKTRNLKVIQGDATKLDWDELLPKNWKLIANLPYVITSFALRKALTAKHPPSKIVVLIQKEVAERVLAKNGKQSLLSLMVALNSESYRIVRSVGNGAFYPAPKVQSAVLEIIPTTLIERKQKWGVDTEEVMRIARVGFAHPRKKLVSNLKLISDNIPQIFEELNLPPNVRAEDVKPADWAHLALLTP